MSASRSIKTLAIMLAAAFLLVAGQAVWADDSECIKCHTDADRLQELTKGLKSKGIEGGPVEPMTRAERVLISEDLMEDENHGFLGCEECHGGDPANSDFDTAHKGVVKDPSYAAPGVCNDCHDQTEFYAQSLHYNVKGMKDGLAKRSNPDPAVQAQLDRAFGHCGACHSSCGQCHVSRPTHAGGGLLDGHKYVKTPETDTTCVSCHEYSVAEYSGRIKGNEPDVHAEADMGCLDCHSVKEMHGGEERYDSIHAANNGPECMECHEDIYADGADNKKTHDSHKDKVSCQVCHAQAYTNCANCHLDQDWSSPKKVESWTDFKIGYNPTPNETNPEQFVTVRHVPIYPGMFDRFAKNALSNFNSVPTWKAASPHTIRRQTPQNSDCNNCHAKRDLFLMRKDVARDLVKANHGAMVPPSEVPPRINQ